MAGKGWRAFDCGVIREVVQIRLRMRRSGRFTQTDDPYLQCDQHECQYVDANVPPCPLSPTMLAQELALREPKDGGSRGW